MGIHKEVRKMFGSSVLNYIISARTAQGFEDAKTATPEERRNVIARWKLHKDEYQSEKQRIMEHGGPEGQESGRLTPTGFLQTRHMSFEERKKLHEDRKLKREAEAKKVRGDGESHSSCPFCRRSATHSHAPRKSQTTAVVEGSAASQEDHHEHHEDFESAIKASVAATSKGNVEEDQMIERAIRASVRELQAAQSSSVNDQEALNRAIQASIVEAGRRRSGEVHEGEEIRMTDEEAEHQQALEKAIQDSLQNYHMKHGGEGEVDETDEEMQKAIKLSKELEEARRGKVPAEDEDEGLKLALKNSKEDFAGKTEEEVVMEYVKKQSLLEEEHRKSIVSVEGTKVVESEETEEEERGRPTKVSDEKRELIDADEEALRLAIEASMGDGGGKVHELG